MLHWLDRGEVQALIMLPCLPQLLQALPADEQDVLGAVPLPQQLRDVPVAPAPGGAAAAGAAGSSAQGAAGVPAAGFGFLESRWSWLKAVPKVNAGQ